MFVFKRFLSTLFLIWSLTVFIAVMIIVFPFILVCSAILSGKRAQSAAFLFLKLWGQAFSILCFYPVRVLKQPGLTPAYIYVCNHNSYLDAIAVVLAIPGSFKPLGKIEMLKVPIFGMIYRRVVVLIDRNSKESRAKSVAELKKDLEGGQSILIFPEGSMNQSDLALAEFYDGAFRLAFETNTPIMPMVLLNARNLLPRKNPFLARPGLITCIFDKAVSPEPNSSVENLKSRVHSTMKTMIEEEASKFDPL